LAFKLSNTMTRQTIKLSVESGPAGKREEPYADSERDWTIIKAPDVDLKPYS